MNGDSNFKTIVYNNGQKYKSAFIEKVLRENLMTNSSSSSSKIDDTKLMHLNKILSNLTYETLKRLNDKNESDKMAKNVFNTLNAATATTTAASSSSGGSSSSNGNETKNTKPSGLSTPSTIKSDINNKKVLNSLKIERIKSSKIQPASSSSEQSNNNEIINLANSSQIVIHVCDEARRLKQDFTCPRDLLVREMKYFSYNLNINVSNTSQSTSGAHAHSSIPTSALSKKSLDEIDISVHCDINIFDWLMRYVKRNHPFLIEKTIASPPSVQDIINDTNNTTATNNHHHPPASKVYEPKLEVNNCVSILLSSDFLIMGDLVDKCIVFIAQNLESVLQIQCVLNGMY